MDFKIEQIEHDLCRAFCADFNVKRISNGSLFVSTPFSFPDGDAFSFYIDKISTGGIRISDKGTTMMHLSYEYDVDIFIEGNRGRIFDQILSEFDVKNDDGEIYIDTYESNIATAIITLGQTLTRILDLTFLDRTQVENTFMEDLKNELSEIAGKDLIVDFRPDIAEAEMYRSDFCINRSGVPLMIWGVSNTPKARLATVIIQHLQKQKYLFKSLVVYQNMMNISKNDLIRLTNAANEQITSLDEKEALRRKVS